jgi:hypothetical protein
MTGLKCSLIVIRLSTLYGKKMASSFQAYEFFKDRAIIPSVPKSISQTFLTPFPNLSPKLHTDTTALTNPADSLNTQVNECCGGVVATLVSRQTN